MLIRILRYILGSGGTLLFDVTIVLQSFVYASAGGGLSMGARGKRKSLIVTGGEEEEGLLAEETATDTVR